MPSQVYTFHALRGINRSSSPLVVRGLIENVPVANAYLASNVAISPSGETEKFIGRTKINASEIFDGVPPAAVYTNGGGGLDDMTLPARDTSVASPTASLQYRVKITTAAATDKFDWSKNGGATWEATGVSITGANQTLDNGVRIIFAAATGHVVNDRWDFNVGNDQIAGMYAARFTATDKLVVATSTELLTADFTNPNWAFTNITGTSTLACPNNRRYGFAFLQNTLIIADHGGSSVRKWTGSGSIATLDISGTGLTTLRAKYLAIWQDYLLLANVTEDGTVEDSHIWWSTEGAIEKFTKTSWTSIGQDDGDEITGMIILGEAIVVFKRNSIWQGRWYGAIATSLGEDGFVFQKVVTGIGNIAPSALVVHNALIYFIAYDGVYTFDGVNQPKRISSPALSGYYGPSLSEEQAMQIWGFDPHNRDEIWFCSQNYVSSSLPTLVYSITNDQWSQSSLLYNTLMTGPKTEDLTIGQVDANIAIGDVNAAIETAFYNTFGLTMLGSGTTNDVYEIAGGTEDGNGVELTYTYETNPHNLGLPGIVKRFTGIRFFLRGTAGIVLAVTISVDGVSKETLTLTAPASILPGKTTFAERSFNYTGENISIKVTNSTSGHSPKLLGMQLYYVPLYERKM